MVYYKNRKEAAKLENDIRSILRSNLIELLSEKQMTQKELSERLNVSQAAVTNWVKGANSPTIDVVEKICNIFSIPISDLLTKKETPLPIEPVTEEDEADPKFWETAAWLQELVIKAGWVKPGEELSDKQDQLLQAIILLLQAGQNPR